MPKATCIVRIFSSEIHQLLDRRFYCKFDILLSGERKDKYKKQQARDLPGPNGGQVFTACDMGMTCPEPPIPSVNLEINHYEANLFAVCNSIKM